MRACRQTAGVGLVPPYRRLRPVSTRPNDAFKQRNGKYYVRRPTANRSRVLLRPASYTYRELFECSRARVFDASQVGEKRHIAVMGD